jgi:hypothetical protein
VFEEYFRATFVVMLKWSDRKKDIFKSLRFNSEDLAEISEGLNSVEKIATRYVSFQSVNGINSAFDKISKDIKFTNLLKSTNPEKDYFGRLQQLIEFRHQIIHSSLIDPTYCVKDFKDDMDLVFDICTIFYEKLIELNNWSETKY